MLYVYGFCDGGATAAVEEYRRQFPMRRIPDRWVFSKVFNTLLACFPLLMFYLNEHVNKMWRNRKSFLKWYGVVLLPVREDFLHVSVFHEHVYGEHCIKAACAKSTPRGQCHASRILSQVINHPLLPLILFTDEAAFILNGTNNPLIRIDGLTTIHMVLWKQNLERPQNWCCKDGR
jgi:hypothetical protein